VAYSTDLEKARDLMIAAAKGHSRVARGGSEEPKVYLREFADSGINMELSVWIKDAEEGQLSLRSDLYWAIWKAFQEAGIEIPFPQRVVHLVAEKTA
jgi:small-conductance mechanosensitive channel